MAPLHFEMSPWEMADLSERVKRARDFLFDTVQNLRDPALRRMVWEMLSDAKEKPARVVEPGAGRPNDPVLDKLRRPLPYDPTVAAPGAAMKSHHCYPGGWAVHTAINLKAALSLADQAEDVKKVAVDRDAIVAGMVLHDWAKLKILVWQDDHTLDDDQGIGHHCIVIAECMLRGFPPVVVHLLAGVHGGWWIKPESVRGQLRRAAQWIERDEVSSRYVIDQDLLTVESWIMRQAELSWYDVTSSAFQGVRRVVEEWHRERGMGVSLPRLRNAVLTTFDELQLWPAANARGFKSLRERLDRWIEEVSGTL